MTAGCPQHQDWLHLVKGAGPRDLPLHTNCCKAQPLKESQVILELCEEGSQGVLKVGCVVLTRLRQIQIDPTAEREHHRKDGTCPAARWKEGSTQHNGGCSSSLEATQLVSPCMSLVTPKPLSLF